MRRRVRCAVTRDRRRSSSSSPRSSRPCGLRRENQISGIPPGKTFLGNLSHCVISTQALHEGHRGQEAAPLLPRQEIGRRRGDARDYWNRAGLHAAHPVRHGERQVVVDAPKEPSCVAGGYSDYTLSSQNPSAMSAVRHSAESPSKSIDRIPALFPAATFVLESSTKHTTSRVKSTFKSFTT